MYVTKTNWLLFSQRGKREMCLQCSVDSLCNVHAFILTLHITILPLLESSFLEIVLQLPELALTATSWSCPELVSPVSRPASGSDRELRNQGSLEL